MRPQHRHKTILIFIMLVAAFMRIVGFVTTSPPGPEHDEVANWLIDKAILAGQHGVYFTQAYGHEAGFHYWQTLFVWLVGDNLVALRASAALMGILAVAVTYALNRRLFGREMALLITALIAVLFMPVFYSRLALRAISLPVTAGLSACFMWDWLKLEIRSQKSEIRKRPTDPPTYRPTEYQLLTTAALFAGLSSYTYFASRALPIFLIGFVVYIAILHRPLLKATWQKWLLFAAVYLAVSAPLILFLQNATDVGARIGEVDAPLRALLAGDFRPVLDNSLAILKGFGISGDPLWRQGVAFRPIFDPLFAILFYGGLLLSLWRIRDIRYGFLLIWLAASVAPSVVTVDAPSTIRMILMVPILATFPIVLLEQIFVFFNLSTSRTKVMGRGGFIHSYPQLSTRINRLSTRKMSLTLKLILTGFILVFYGARTGRDLFQTWANNEEVRFVWQETLTEIGRHIDEDPSIKHVAIAGWTPDTMDDPTLELVLHNDDVERRHFGRIGEIQTLIVPPAPSAIYRPNELPLNPHIEALFSGVQEKLFTVFTDVEIDSIEFEPLRIPFQNSTSGNRLIFLGHQMISVADQVELLSFWEVGDYPSPAAPNTKLFVHLVDENGNLLAQHDGLDAPHRFWQMGDTIIQFHSLNNVDGAAELRIGVYVGQAPWPRFVTPTGADFVQIKR